MSTADLERTAHVLELAGFTRYLDNIGRRSVFVSDPSSFNRIAFSSRADEIDMAMIKDAVMRLANGNVRSSLEIEKIAEGLMKEL